MKMTDRYDYSALLGMNVANIVVNSTVCLLCPPSRCPSQISKQRLEALYDPVSEIISMSVASCFGRLARVHKY